MGRLKRDMDVLGIMDGVRENAESWRGLPRGQKKRGLRIAPDLACGDCALGFWPARRVVYTRRASRPQIAQALGILQRVFGFTAMSMA